MRDKKGKRGREQGPRINGNIIASECRLMGDDGIAHGVVSLSEARRIADEAGMDLVEVSPNAKPPVVKVIDYGKFKYNQQKKASENKKKQVATQLKETQFRPNIEAHDLDTKVKRIEKFLHQGDKIKLVMQFRGREMAYKDAGLEKFKTIIDSICELGGIVESIPKMMGNRIICILAADKKKIRQLEKDKAYIERYDAKQAEQEEQESSEKSVGPIGSEA